MKIKTLKTKLNIIKSVLIKEVEMIGYMEIAVIIVCIITFINIVFALNN